MADDLGYPTQLLRRRDYTTPRLDALAASGVRLTRFIRTAASARQRGRADHAATSMRAGRAAGADQRREPRLQASAGHPTLPRCCAASAIAPRWSASGTSALRRRRAQQLRYDTSSATTAAARATIRCRRRPAPRRDLQTAARSPGTLPDRRVRRRGGALDRRRGASRSSQPAFQRAHAPWTRAATSPARCAGATPSTATAAICRSTARWSARSTRTSARCSTRSTAWAWPTTHRRLHQRQRRRSLLRHVAVHRAKGNCSKAESACR